MGPLVFIATIFYSQPKLALAWLQEAFGFEIALLIEGPNGDDRMLHAEMSFEQARLRVSGQWADWSSSPSLVNGKNTQSLHVQLAAGIDAHCERARSAGALVVEEPKTQFFGERTYRCVDLEGHHWTFAERVQTLSVAEMEQAGGVKFKSSI
jgi:uncharacterized glyoxalase superfamily protein PhnB